jgi:hypothetical protein
MKKKDQVNQNREQLVNLLLSKASLKQDIADDCEKVFVMLKDAIKKELLGLQEKITDKRVRLSYKEKGNYEIHVFVGSDVLVFSLHNNVFRLPDENPLWGTAYFQADSDHGYFGIINIYNFLAESFIQNRLDDIGYLIARIKINKERHFMVEGNGQLGSLFRDPQRMEINEELITLIVQMSFHYAMSLDLLIPPYANDEVLSVAHIQSIGEGLRLKTGKQLGFKMKHEDTEN